MKYLLLCTSVLLSAQNVKAMNGNDDDIYHSDRKCGDWIVNRDFYPSSPFNVFLVVAPPKDVFSLSERATEHMQSLRANDLEPSIIELPEEDRDTKTGFKETVKRNGIRKTRTYQKSGKSVAAFIAAIKENSNKKIHEIVRDIAKERGCTRQAIYHAIRTDLSASQYLKKHLDRQTRKDIVQDFLASKANNPHLGNTVIATRVGAQYSVSLGTVMRQVNKAHPGVYFFRSANLEQNDERFEVSSESPSQSLLEGLRSTKVKPPFAEGRVLRDTAKKDGDLLGKNQNDSLSEEGDGVNTEPKKTGKRKGIRKTRTKQESHVIVSEFIAAKEKNPKNKTSKIVRDIAKKQKRTWSSVYKWIQRNPTASQYLKKQLGSEKIKEIVEDFVARKNNNPQMSNYAIAKQVGACYFIGERSVVRYVNRRYPGRYFFLSANRKKRDKRFEVASDDLSQLPREVLPPNTLIFQDVSGMGEAPSDPSGEERKVRHNAFNDLGGALNQESVQENLLHSAVLLVADARIGDETAKPKAQTTFEKFIESL